MSDTPIPFAEIGRAVTARDPLTEPRIDAIQHTLFVTGRDPAPEVRAIEEIRPVVRTSEEATFRIDLEIPRMSIGVHSFGPGAEGVKLSARRRLLTEEEHPDAVVGFLPDHLGLRSTPAKLDRRFRPRVKRKVPVPATRRPGGRPRSSATTTATPSTTPPSPGAPPAAWRPRAGAGPPAPWSGPATC